jgi:hypothetical protein
MAAKIAQLKFNSEMGIKPTNEQLSELYEANKEILDFFKAQPKREFILSKTGKENRTVKARCTAEILSNPANIGWEIVS